MNVERFPCDSGPTIETPDARRIRLTAAARRIAGMAAAVTIVVSFWEAAVNPAASCSALHFWLALFMAAATRDEEAGETCRS
jgi:hypothetical protein